MSHAGQGSEPGNSGLDVLAGNTVNGGGHPPVDEEGQELAQRLRVTADGARRLVLGLKADGPRGQEPGDRVRRGAHRVGGAGGLHLHFPVS